MNVSPDEKLARFVFSRKDFSPRNGTVKFKAFMPPRDSENKSVYHSDLSVYRTSVLSDSEVWEIGREYVQTAERRLKARADLSVADVYRNNLKVIPDPQSHKLHANITPFPSDRIACQRIATELARTSKLVIPPEDN